MSGNQFQPGRPRDFLIVLAYGVATITAGLLLWLGPLAYGVSLLSRGNELAGWILVALGGGWAVVLGRDVLPGFLVGAIHSILIFARVVKDPWEGER